MRSVARFLLVAPLVVAIPVVLLVGFPAVTAEQVSLNQDNLSLFVGRSDGELTSRDTRAKVRWRGGVKLWDMQSFRLQSPRSRIRCQRP